MQERFNDELIYVKGKNVDYIQFKRLLELGVDNAYTITNPNLDFKTNSPKEKESYKVLCEELGYDFDKLCKPIQVHSSTVKCVDDDLSQIDLKATDGLITSSSNLVLSTKNADCILLIIYDTKNKVLANVHSGWRGTFSKIAEKTVVKMRDVYGTNPEDVVVAISPSIRKCHFEVDEDVAFLCEKTFGYTNKLDKFIEKTEIKDGKQKYHIDNVLINKIMLMELGVKEENIIDSELCSVCNKDIFSSYRADGVDTNRNILICKMK